MGRRRFRAHTPARARCATCGELLFLLRWGHEERCLEYSERRARRYTRVGLVLLVLSIALMSWPAHAQGLDPAAVQAGFERNALATIAGVELLAIAYLFWSLQKAQEARFADLTRSYEAAMKLQESGVKLSIQALEAVEVVEHLVERMPPRST